MTKSIPISFFDDPKIKAKLKRVAKEKGVTLSALIRMIIRDFIREEFEKFAKKEKRTRKKKQK